jgi:hypothetical protein
MGFTITATNSKYSFNGGAGGFYNLRKNIAKAFDAEFGAHYEKLIYCHSKEDHKAFDKETERILNKPRFKEEDYDVMDFFFFSDTEGSIAYSTCKKIYDLIKDIDFGNQIFTYPAHSKGDDYEQFKAFLLDCYKRRAKMRWN